MCGVFSLGGSNLCYSCALAPYPPKGEKGEDDAELNIEEN